MQNTFPSLSKVVYFQVNPNNSESFRNAHAIEIGNVTVDENIAIISPNFSVTTTFMQFSNLDTKIL